MERIRSRPAVNTKSKVDGSGVVELSNMPDTCANGMFPRSVDFPVVGSILRNSEVVFEKFVRLA